MKSKKKSGFTLIEVIVSMALIGILIVPVTMIWSNIKYYNVSARSKVNNAAVAQKVMEYYRRFNITSNASYSALTTNPSTQYYYYFVYTNDAAKDVKNLNPSTEELTNKLNNTKIDTTGNLDENYTDALKRVTTSGSPYHPITGVSSFNQLVKVSFINKNGMFKIEVNVWSTLSKDSGKIQYIMLRRYNL